MKIGIFGGSFDPPHLGHINICKAFIESFKFDFVYVIPAFLPPHKRLGSDTSAKMRLEMTRLAFSEFSEKVVVSDLEIKRQGKSYTADTIKYFKDNFDAEIYFLCGTDMILTMDSWWKPEYIFNNAKIVYVRRENDIEISQKIEDKCKLYFHRYAAEIIPLKCNVLEISSTEIREALYKKSSVQGLIAPNIYDFIVENNLYNME